MLADVHATTNQGVTMTLIKLKSDNFDQELITPEAYEYVALTMSTGDHATHETEVFVMPKTDPRAKKAIYISRQIIIMCC